MEIVKLEDEVRFCANIKVKKIIDSTDAVKIEANNYCRFMDKRVLNSKSHI